MLSTVTGNVKSILNDTSFAHGVVVFTLAGYGASPISIAGSKNSIVGTTNTAPILSDGSFSIQVHSNDSITPAGTGYLVYVSTDVASFGPFFFTITGPSVSLNSATSKFLGVSFPIANTLFENASVQYVSTGGSDSNDGLSWATAKLTVYGALQALPGGSAGTAGSGVVYFMDTCRAQSTIGMGLWLMGQNDPNYASPPAGWLKAQNSVLNIIGIPAQNYGPTPHMGRAALVGGGGNDNLHPGVWLSGLATTMVFENIDISFPGRAWVIGVDSNNAITPALSGVVGVTFINCTGSTSQGAGLGPTWTIGGESFWIEFIDCGGAGSIGANGHVAADDTAQAFLIDGRGSSGGQIINFRGYTNLGQGGIKFYPGSNNISQISIEDCTEEGSFTGSAPVAPILWVTSGASSGNIMRVGSAIIADGGSATMAAVQNDGTAQVFVCNAWGVGINVQGPVISVADYGPNYQNLVISPVRQGQLGFFGGRVFGQLDDSRRQFLSFARFVNIAPTNPANWTTLTSSTVTTGTAAPDGTTNAARISTTAAFNSGAQFFRNNITFAVGDWVVIGGWVRSNSANGTIGNPFFFSTVTSGFVVNGGNSIFASHFIAGDGEWQFLVGAGKISAIGTNPCDTEFQGLTDSTHTMDVYSPVCLHIATGVISDNEVYAVMTSLVSQRSDAPAGSISLPAAVPLQVDGIRMPKIASAIAAPGADIGFLRWEAGTNAGTLKMVAYAGTSATGVTVIDNVGAGN